MRPDRAAQPDPLRAVVRVCRTCGHVGLPADAEWVSDELVLATFTQTCEHAPQEPATLIVNPGDLQMIELQPAEPGEQ